MWMLFDHEKCVLSVGVRGQNVARNQSAGGVGQERGGLPLQSDSVPSRHYLAPTSSSQSRRRRLSKATLP